MNPCIPSQKENVFMRPRQANPCKDTLTWDRFSEIVRKCDHYVLYRVSLVLSKALNAMSNEGTTHADFKKDVDELNTIVSEYGIGKSWVNTDNHHIARFLINKYKAISLTAILNEYSNGHEVMFPEYNIQG